MRARQEPDREQFSRGEDYAYAEDVARDVFEQDWEASGSCVVRVLRMDPNADAETWSRSHGSRQSVGQRDHRMVVGSYEQVFGGVGQVPSEITKTNTIGLVAYGVEVRSSDVLLVTEGDSPYLGRKLRAEQTRYFPRSRRCLVAAQLVS